MPAKHKRSWMPFIIPAGLISAMLMIANYFQKQNPVLLAAGIAIAIITVIVLFISNMKRSNAEIDACNEAEELNSVLQKSGFVDMVDFVKYREGQTKARDLYNNYKNSIWKQSSHRKLLPKKTVLKKYGMHLLLIVK